MNTLAPITAETFAPARRNFCRPDIAGRTEMEIWEGVPGKSQSSTAFTRQLYRAGNGYAAIKQQLLTRYPTLRLTAIEVMIERCQQHIARPAGAPRFLAGL